MTRREKEKKKTYVSDDAGDGERTADAHVNVFGSHQDGHRFDDPQLDRLRPSAPPRRYLRRKEEETVKFPSLFNEGETDFLT